MCLIIIIFFSSMNRRNKMYIYAIKSKIHSFFIHIGSTTLPLNIRWNKHKSDSKTKSSHLYRYIRNHGGIENYYIELIREVDGDIKELRKVEGDIIRDYKKKTDDFYVLNTRIECRNTQEYYQDNRELILQNKRDYYKNNKIKKQEYYKNNRDIILQKRREFYQKHKKSKNVENDITE